MEIDVIEGPGERLFHPRRLQHFDSVRVAQDARFPGPGAQGVGELSGSPVGVHVDHGRYLHGLPAVYSFPVAIERGRLASVSYTSGDGATTVPSYLAEPEGEGPHPA